MMPKETHLGEYGKIPLHRGHVAVLARDLNMHRNTLLKKWTIDDPQIIYAVAIRQVELEYPQDEEHLRQIKLFLRASYERRAVEQASQDETP